MRISDWSSDVCSSDLSNGYQQAQYEKGIFTIETISVGQTFAAALAPGLVLVVIYVAYMLLKAWLSPKAAPALVVPAERPATASEIGRHSCRARWGQYVWTSVVAVHIKKNKRKQ